jgi:predicted dehydrogenase
VNKKRIKLGIIGCGIATKNLHYPALTKLKDKFEVVVVCNHTEQKAKQVSAMFGNVPYTLDYRAVISNKDVEAVDIVLPIDLNYQTIVESVRSGKHVICEKPLAASLTQGRRLVRLSKTTDKVVMIAENFRYMKLFREVGKIIKSGIIGKPYSLIWNSFTYFDKKNEYAVTKWRKNHKYPGGFILDGGVHCIAAIRSLAGDIVSGTAFCDSINPNLGKIDTFSLQFKTCRGINGVFNYYFSANGLGEFSVYVFGHDGTILVQGNKIVVKRTGKKDKELIVNDDGGYYAEFADFYRAIRSGREIVGTVSEAYLDMQTIITAIK